MNDQWTERLSEYLDGALEQAERDALEHHLLTCADCRHVLTGLQRVLERAHALEAMPPARDLWSGIAHRIGAKRRTGVLTFARQRLTFTVPQLAAAAVVLMTIAAGTVGVVFSRGRTTSPQPAGPTAVEPAWTPRVTPVTTPRLDAAVLRLEQSLLEGRERLDTATVRVLERNLAIIDRAIAEAYRALEADPASTFLNHHLTNQKLRKLDLLRRANQLAARS